MTLPDYLAASAGDFGYPAAELSDVALYGWGLVTEAAGIASTYAEELAALAGPAARAAADWATGPGLDHVANAAGKVADGTLDGLAGVMDTVWAPTAAGGAIDTNRPRYHGHPQAIDRPRRAR